MRIVIWNLQNVDPIRTDALYKPRPCSHLHILLLALVADETGVASPAPSTQRRSRSILSIV